MEKSGYSITAAPAVEVHGLSRSFGKVKALDGVSFTVRKGELFGLIGPDGAGKSTLLRILTTLLDPDAGTAKVNGHDIAADYREIRNEVGYVPGRFSLYQDLTVAENLRFFAAAFRVEVEKNYALIETVYRKLEPFSDRKAGLLSGGMKQKLALCCALIHRPPVLFLDEPTTGVDAVSRSEFWEVLEQLREKGISMLVSTPYMDEAARCDRIALMDKGRMLDVDSPAGMVEKDDSIIYAVEAREMYPLLQFVRKGEGVLQAWPFGAVHHLVAGPQFNPDAFRSTLESAGFTGIRMERIHPGIEDIFIKLMQ